MREERVTAAMNLPRRVPMSSCSIIASCWPRQRRASAGSMPMASIVSAWRRLAPTSLMLATPASFASFITRRVSMSESTPSSSRMISEARPTSP